MLLFLQSSYKANDDETIKKIGLAKVAIIIAQEQSRLVRKRMFFLHPQILVLSDWSIEFCVPRFSFHSALRINSWRKYTKKFITKQNLSFPSLWFFLVCCYFQYVCVRVCIIIFGKIFSLSLSLFASSVPTCPLLKFCSLSPSSLFFLFCYNMSVLECGFLFKAENKWKMKYFLFLSNIYIDIYINILYKRKKNKPNYFLIQIHRKRDM